MTGSFCLFTAGPLVVAILGPTPRQVNAKGLGLFWQILCQNSPSRDSFNRCDSSVLANLILLTQPHGGLAAAGVLQLDHRIGSLQKMVDSIEALNISADAKSRILGRNTAELLQL